MPIINDFQFEDETATRVTRKKRFGLVFVFLTLIPATSIVFYFTWIAHTDIDMLAFTGPSKTLGTILRDSIVPSSVGQVGLSGYSAFF